MTGNGLCCNVGFVATVLVVAVAFASALTDGADDDDFPDKVGAESIMTLLASFSSSLVEHRLMPSASYASSNTSSKALAARCTALFGGLYAIALRNVNRISLAT